MATIEKFEDLEVWREARKLVQSVYRATGAEDFSRDFGLRGQIQRAAVSIMSNVAEGFERSGNKEFSHFLYLAKGSAGEVRSQLYIALDLGYLDEKSFAALNASALSIARQLSGFIKYLNRNTGSRASASPPNLKI